VLAAVVIAYFGMASGERSGHYNLLADAFAHGQLHLTVPPRPELFELAEPYDPTKNDPYRLHDATLYRGKYYLYFGPAPAVVLFLPWRLLGLGELPEPVAAAIFSSGAFLFGVALLRHLARRQQPVAALVLGYANVAPFIVRGAAAYEVAIAAGACFLAGSAYFLVTALADTGHVRMPRLWLGSLFLGLAVGSRINHVLTVPLVLLLAWPALRATRALWHAAAATLVPVLACGALLGLYNFARFSSWTEFGTTYMLVGARVLWFDLPSLPPALYFHFVAPPAIRSQLPFVFTDAVYPGALPEGYYAEPITGVFLLLPFLLILLLAPLLLRKPETPALLRERLLNLGAIGLASPVLTSIVFPATAMRYQMDYATFLVIPALVLWSIAAQQSPRPRLVGAVGLVLMVVGGVMMAAFAVRGGEGALETRTPTVLQPIKKRTAPGHQVLRFRAAFPEKAAAEEEVLASSGTVQEHDLLIVRQVAASRWTFVVRPANGDDQVSPPVELEPNRFYACEVELDGAGKQVLVRVEGGEVARLPSTLVPLYSPRVWLGRGPRGRGAPELDAFSGTILPEAMLAAGEPGLDSLPPIAPGPAVHTAADAPPPSSPVLGQLWVKDGKRGAYLWTGDRWRWIPRPREKTSPVSD
jgi:hypothetical protein